MASRTAATTLILATLYMFVASPSPTPLDDHETTPASLTPPASRWRPTPPPIRKSATKRRRPTVKKTPLVARAPKSSSRQHRSRLPIRKELSAGGVVVRQDQGEWYVALLKTEHKRGQVWVLPKGHVELKSGERVSDAARREVQEEAGVRDLSVKNQLGVTRFKFQAENALVYKTVHYFLMVTQQKQLQPQVEEGLLEAAWFPIEEAITNLEYDTDQDIVGRARDRLRGETLPSRQGRPSPRSPVTPRRGRPRHSTRIHT